MLEQENPNYKGSLWHHQGTNALTQAEEGRDKRCQMRSSAKAMNDALQSNAMPELLSVKILSIWTALCLASQQLGAGSVELKLKIA